KTLSPLILIDPIQKERNAAAAVSKKKYDSFVKTCGEFLKRPSREFFEVKPLAKESVQYDRKSHDLFFLECQPLQGKKDVVGAKIMKAYYFILAELEKNEFEVADSGFEFLEKGKIYFVLSRKKLSDKMLVKGPLAENSGENITAFRKKHKKVLKKGCRYFAEEKRKYVSPKEFFNAILRHKYIKERVKKVELL
ncbi:MAG: hypothetical protein V1659_03775, partial [Candidatus Woesearchaeota archaeon]